MTALVYLAIYTAALVFIVGTVRRIIFYSRAPMHLRWELYPVPHESPEKVAHGGSYFEDSDWWTKTRRRNRFGELAAMLPEMLFMKALWEHNRALWFLSFPFHFGLYTTTGGCALALLTSLAHGIVGFRTLSLLASGCVTAGLMLVLIGAIALFLRRFLSRALANYTTGADLFNVGASAVAAALILAARVAGPHASVVNLARGLLTFDTSVAISPLLTAGIVMASAMAAYVPYTHMAHFVAKYFTYHQVRWDDEPNRNQQQMARRIAEYLSYKPSWAARHVGANGTRTWADVAMLNPHDVSADQDVSADRGERVRQ